jgi:hypothetical protein
MAVSLRTQMDISYREQPDGLEPQLVISFSVIVPAMLLFASAYISRTGVGSDRDSEMAFLSGEAPITSWEFVLEKQFLSSFTISWQEMQNQFQGYLRRKER